MCLKAGTLKPRTGKRKKEFKVDTTEWSFIIEVSTGTFTIEVITTGEKLGEIVLGEDVKLNGKEPTMSEEV